MAFMTRVGWLACPDTPSPIPRLARADIHISIASPYASGNCSLPALESPHIQVDGRGVGQAHTGSWRTLVNEMSVLIGVRGYAANTL